MLDVHPVDEKSSYVHQAVSEVVDIFYGWRWQGVGADSRFFVQLILLGIGVSVHPHSEILCGAALREFFS